MDFPCSENLFFSETGNVKYLRECISRFETRSCYWTCKL